MNRRLCRALSDASHLTAQSSQQKFQGSRLTLEPQRSPVKFMNASAATPLAKGHGCRVIRGDAAPTLPNASLALGIHYSELPNCTGITSRILGNYAITIFSLSNCKHPLKFCCNRCGFLLWGDRPLKSGLKRRAIEVSSIKSTLD